MDTENVKALVGKYPDDGSEKPIVARERGTADTGENPSALCVRTEIEQRWPSNRPDQHKVPATMLA
jgi:hypothetical protein